MREGSRQMTQMLTGTRRSRRERSAGLIQRLQGAEMSVDDRQQRLNAAMADYERARKAGDDTAAAAADERIEAVLAEARSGRGEMPTLDKPRSRRRRRRASTVGSAALRSGTPFIQEPSPSMLPKMAMESSHARRLPVEWGSLSR
jgi:hypothetical protein